MIRVWLFLHLLGFTAWIGGALASMVAGFAGRREDRARLGAIVRAQSAIEKILIAPGALLTVLVGGLLLLASRTFPPTYRESMNWWVAGTFLLPCSFVMLVLRDVAPAWVTVTLSNTMVALSVGCIAIACSAHQAWSANIFTTVSDMFPKRAVASVTGIGGMAGALGGILIARSAGVLLAHYTEKGHVEAGYAILFVACGSAYIVAWLIMHLLVPKFSQVKLD